MGFFITKDQLKQLMNKKVDNSMSIYLPTIHKGKETRQNHIRFKNLLRQGEKQLKSSGLRKNEIEQIMQPVNDLFQNNWFWNYQSQGLAVFVSSEFYRYYLLPVKVEELVVITDHFYIKPLIPLIQNQGYFYLLDLSLKHTRLYQGTQFNMQQVEVKDMPTDIEEILKYDDPERQIQFHTKTRSGLNDRSAVFHGQGVGTDGKKENIQRFFHIINKSINFFMSAEKAPLILSGMDYLHPIYQELNTYPHLIKEGIRKNVDRLSPETLHTRAWNVLEPLFKQEQQKALEQYHNQIESDKTTKGIQEVLVNAYEGRIQTLFLQSGIQCWGKFNPPSLSVDIHKRRQKDDEDLYEMSAVYTFLNGGDVLVLEPELITDHPEIFALLRA
ncbi:MAG: hypothetical protein R6V04_11435 [bacterium]